MPQRISIRSPFRGGRRSIVRGGSPRRRSIVRGPSGSAFRRSYGRYFGGATGDGRPTKAQRTPEGKTVTTVAPDQDPTEVTTDGMDIDKESLPQRTGELMEALADPAAQTPRKATRLLTNAFAQYGVPVDKADEFLETLVTQGLMMTPGTSGPLIEEAQGKKPKSPAYYKAQLADRQGTWKTTPRPLADGTTGLVRQLSIYNGSYPFQQYEGTDCLLNWKMVAIPNPKNPEKPIWKCVDPKKYILDPPTAAEKRKNPETVAALKAARKQKAAETRALKSPNKKKQVTDAEMQDPNFNWEAYAQRKFEEVQSKNTVEYYEEQIRLMEEKNKLALEKLRLKKMKKEAGMR
jgi:hypothetical protein